MLRRKKLLIAILMLFIALGGLIFAGLNSCSVSYYTVSEFLLKADSKYGDEVRIGGRVVDGSIEWDAEALDLRFEIAEDDKVLPVEYKGAKPEKLAEGKDVFVEGKYEPDGIFHASELIFQCPSKYEAKD